MDAFAVADSTGDMRLHFTPADGKLMMTVMDRFAMHHASVMLETAYLRPLAAWLAGEAQPVRIGERPRRIAVIDDEAAMIWCTYAWARLRCHQPYGDARVTVGPRRPVDAGLTVVLAPEVRAEVAAWLRRVDAQSWTRPKSAA